MSKNWMKSEIANNVKGVLNKETVNTLKNKETFGVSYIKITDIVRNKHNLVVRPVNGKYEIISGERRFTALSKLYEEGSKEYEKVPCKVVEVDDVQAMIMLIQANAQSREITENIRLKQIKLLNVLYSERKSNNIVLSKYIQEEIANALDISVSQVRKYESITKASDKIQKSFENNDLTFSQATSLSRLSKEGQDIAIDIIESSKDKVNVEEVKKQIKEVEQDKKKQIKNTKDKDELNKVEQNFKEKLNKIKDTYIKTNEENDITEISNKILIKSINNELSKLTKRAEKLVSEISELTKVDNSTLEEFNKLENIICGIKEEIDIVIENNK